MQQSHQRPTLRRPFRVAISLTVLASPALRRLFGRAAARYLYHEVSVDARAMAFALLSRLGVRNDPVFVWYVLDFLLAIPEQTFEDKWISVALLPFERVPVPTVRERILVCQSTLTNLFGLGRIVASAVKISLGSTSLFLGVPPGRPANPTQAVLEEFVRYQEAALLAWASRHGLSAALALNDKEAFAKITTECAERNDHEAQFVLSLLYSQGYGLASDSRLAAEWLHKAAQGGSKIAQCSLGYVYGMGAGVQKDPEEAKKWLSAASANGFAPAARAMSALGL